MLIISLRGPLLLALGTKLWWSAADPLGASRDRCDEKSDQGCQAKEGFRLASPMDYTLKTEEHHPARFSFPTDCCYSVNVGPSSYLCLLCLTLHATFADVGSPTSWVTTVLRSSRNPTQALKTGPTDKTIGVLLLACRSGQLR